MRTSTRRGQRTPLVAVLLGALLSLPALAAPAAAAVNLTPASGGQGIDAIGQYRPLSGPTLAESAGAEIGVGTIVLRTPPGFEFATAPGRVTVSVTDHGTCRGSAKPLRLGGSRLASQSVTPTATSLTVDVTQASRGTCRGTLTWSGIQVKALQAASGSLTEKGSSPIAGVSDTAGWGALSTSEPAAPTPCTGPRPFTAPDFVEVAGPLGTLGAVVGEPTGRFLYAANTRADRVEVLDLSTREVLCPIRVGAGPVGLDVGSDGSRLYTANSDGSISVVDTASRHEVRRVPVPDLYGDEQPLGLAVASNGKALITTGPSYGSWGSVMELDTSSLQVRTRYDVNRLYNGRLRASADRSTIGLVGCGVSDGPLIVYRAGTDSFQEERNLHGLTCDVALSRTGSSLLVGPSTRVVSSTSLDMRGSFTGYSEYGGVAWRPSYSTGFRLSSPGRVDVLDLTRFLVAGHLTLPDTTTYAGSGGIGRMTVTPDGRTLAVLTDRGIAVLTLSSLPSAPTCAKPASGMSSTGLARLPSFAGDVAIDRQRAFAYISHPERNQVEVLNLSTGAFDCPILVGSSPQALDLSPDGTSLYTANSGGNNISVVDVATRQEVRKRRVPYGWLNETPRSLAAAANGRVLITMTCCGSGRLPVWEFSPSSDTVRHRADALGDGYATTWTWLKANADRSAIGIAMGDSRPATAGAYRSAGDTFVGRSDIPSFIGSAAVSADGSRLLVNPGTYVFDEVMASRGTIAEGYYGVAFAPAGLTAYRVGPTGVQVVSADTGVVQRTLALPDTLTAATNHSPVGRITVSADGQLLAVTTDHGVAFLTP